jgi:hypothetical protein
MEIRAYRRQHYFDRVCKHQYENETGLDEFDDTIFEQEMYFEDLQQKISISEEDKTVDYKENQMKISKEKKALQ